MENENTDPVEINKETLTKQQKKNKKKREAAKQKRQNQSQVNTQESVHEENNDVHQVVSNESEPTDEEDTFEEELCWCIQQIHIGLQSRNASTEQVLKSKKCMDQLKSKKTPKPKKRMLMRIIFGDYREKMRKEKKQLQVKAAKFVDVDDKVIKKSIFFRKKVNDLPSAPSEEAQEFRFNFPEPT